MRLCRRARGPGVCCIPPPPRSAGISSSPKPPPPSRLTAARGRYSLGRARLCARTSHGLATKEIRCQLMPVYKDICHPELGRSREEMRRCGGGREPESELFILKAEYEGASDEDDADVSGAWSGTDPCALRGPRGCWKGTGGLHLFGGRLHLLGGAGKGSGREEKKKKKERKSR